MNKYLSAIENERMQKLSAELTNSELIVQHSLSCIIAKMMRAPELYKRLVFDLSETSMREALDALTTKGLVKKIIITEKIYFGLTPEGSNISPFVKKLLYAQQSQPVLF